MKKMIAMIALLSAVVLFALFKDQTQEETEGNLPIVGILQLTSHPALDLINDGILAALAEEGFKDGQTMTLDFQNAQGDQSNLKAMSERFASERASVMVGIATPAAQALANASKEIPIVLGAVTDPEGAGLVKSNEEPGGNVTGVSDITPIAQQFDLIRQILPEAKTIGILYSSGEDNSAVQAEQAEMIAKEMEFETITMTLTSTNDVSQIAADLAKKSDAIWVPTDNAVASAMNTLLKETDQQQIPVFPAVDTMVEQGGLATIGLDQYELGRETGKMTADILKGIIKPADEPIRTSKEGQLYVNEDKAKSLDIRIPQELLEKNQLKGAKK